MQSAFHRPWPAPVSPTILAISGEAHRHVQGYRDGRILVGHTGSELSVAGFVRFIAGLAGTVGRLRVRVAKLRRVLPIRPVYHEPVYVSREPIQIGEQCHLVHSVIV
jgi:hypothetical protein